MMRTDWTNAELELSLRVSLSDEQVAELMADDIPAEYDVDYSKAKPNRFAKRKIAPRTAEQDSDVIAVPKAEEASRGR